MLARVFPVQQLQDCSGSAAHVEHVLERLERELLEHLRIVVLAHLVDSGMAGLVDLRRLGELFDGKLLELFCRSGHEPSYSWTLSASARLTRLMERVCRSATTR